MAHAPICEYSVPGLFSMAFPTLFPDGTGDWTRGQNAHPLALALYIKHLMRFGDGRFRRHKIFRYFVFNFHRRHAARGQATVFVARNRFAGCGDLDQFQQLLDENRHDALVQRLVAFSGSTPGSNAFWKARSSELQSFIRFCEYERNPCTLFFTFSSADRQWPELRSLLNQQRSDAARPAFGPNDDPACATWFSHHRFDQFFHRVFRKLLGIKRFWYRTEFQARGSTHIHGLASIADAPDCFALCKDGNVQPLIDWVENDLLVTAMHPDVASVLPGYQGTRNTTNPLQRDFREVADLDEDYRHIVNCCQRHFCRRGYCLRGPGDGECRFGYPKPNLEHAQVVRDRRGRYVIELARNDGRVNPHIKIVLLAWRANVDVSIVVDADAVRRYVGKYAAKSEQRSAALNETLRAIVASLSERGLHHISALGVWHRLLNRCLVERDYSAQEVSWLTMGGESSEKGVGGAGKPEPSGAGSGLLLLSALGCCVVSH
jgi:hypothetical protein